METKLNSLHIRKRKGKDLCPVCDYNLYFNKEYTKRIGLLDKDKEITGWMCPKCNSEFDFNNKIVYIYGEKYARGEA